MTTRGACCVSAAWLALWLLIGFGAWWHLFHEPARADLRGPLFEPPALVVPKAPPRHVRGTAYCSCSICTGKWSEFGLTAIGVAPREGWTVAADPRVFPLRSCVRVNGRVMRVQDTGSAIKGAHIDIYFVSHDDAKTFGVRSLVVEPWVC